MLFRHSMSIAQHFMPIYNTAVQKIKSNVGLNLMWLTDSIMRHQQATRAERQSLTLSLSGAKHHTPGQTCTQDNYLWSSKVKKAQLNFDEAKTVN